MVAVGGACHQPDLLPIFLVGVRFADQVIERLFPDSGIEALQEGTGDKRH
jgi:hypothetical protein